MTESQPRGRATEATSRVTVPKTYKLFIGGAFPRSESGRTVEVMDAAGGFLANAARASRKDARTAVVAARSASPRWSAATAYNRGQVLYRVAELLDGRRQQFIDEVVATGATRDAAETEVDAAVATWVFFAGFCDKYAQVLGSANPVAAPYFNFSLPEPTGVVAVIAPQQPGWSLRGIAATIAPAIASGNTTVLVAHERNPLSAISFAEVVATSDVPAGVINILTGSIAELAPHLASHMDVNAIDLAGIDDATLAADLESRAADNLKRVRRPRRLDAGHAGSLADIESLVEIKTVWHPVGV